MKVTRLGGIVGDMGTYIPEKVEMAFEADAAIVVGNLVMPDTGNTAGTLVVTAAASSTGQTNVIGLYEGVGGSGDATTTTGLTGNDAADGDFLFVTCYGPGTANADAACTDGTFLIPSATTAGHVTGGTTGTVAGYPAPLLALEACTAGENAAKRIFMRLL